MSERTLTGVSVTPLSGVGPAVWYEPTAPSLPDETDASPEAERERFEAARERAREELEAERDRIHERIGKGEAAVFEAHIQFLRDPMIIDRVADAIDDGDPAERAVEAAFGGAIEQFSGMSGKMAERADDLRDIRDRLLRLLVGGERVDLGAVPTGSVVLAERLTPSDTAQLDPDRVAGLATVAGGRTSHAAIIARSLGIPAVVGVGEALREVGEDDPVAVFGGEGEVVADPTPETRERAAGGETAPVRRDPVETTDGRSVEVAANVGTAGEAASAADRGADGVGLFRTEFLFLDREAPPTEDEQYEAICEVCEAFPGERVVVRTLDVGGDKPIPYLDLDEHTHSFLGLRGIRLSLADHADLFETQLRALLRAAADHEGLAVMFPLVSTVEEVEDAVDRVADVAADLDAEGVAYDRPELGVMVETPAATLLAAEFAERVSFLSVGTNDLAQYVMAAGRDNDRVGDLQDPLHPAVLRAVARTVDAGHSAGAWVGMCGEMAGDPDLTELLVGLGLDELSMGAVTVPAVKARVAETNREDARRLAQRALGAETRAEIEALLSD